jgi:hypothetical protein
MADFHKGDAMALPFADSSFDVAMPPDAVAGLKTRVRTHLREDPAGRISYGAWANAIKGRGPG